MQKSLKRLLTIPVILSLLLASCAGGDPNTDDTGDNGSDQVTDSNGPDQGGEELTGRAAAKDDLPADLSFGGETLRIYHRASFTENIDLMNGDEEGDAFSYEIYKRNQTVSDRLGVNFDFFTTAEDSVGKVAESILAGDDTIDIILHTEWKTVGLVAEGAFLNMADRQYLDLSKEWWLPNVTSELNILEDKIYLFTGEMLTENIGSMSAMYVNKNLFTDLNGSVDDFYDMILNGDWTYDVFYNYVENAYKDDGDGKRSLGDQYGFAGDCYSSVDRLTFASDISYYNRDENGLPVLNMNTPKMVDLVNDLYRLYWENTGTLVEAEDKLVSHFVNDEVLFMGFRLDTSMNTNMREMKSDYGIIPYPKFSEGQEEYSTLLHNASPVIAIPNTCKKLDAVCATLEALSAESYRSVTPVYYETALKTRYTRDDVSSQMIDIIYNSARKDLIYDLNPEKAGQITRTLVDLVSNNFSSIYKANETTYVDKLNELVEAINELE